MRDPYRIYCCCNELCKLWARVPDMRLGQLLENAGVTFYTEDGDMIQKVKEFVDKIEQKKAE